MNMIKQIGIAYFKGIDATIRFLGAYIIMALLIMVIYALCYVLTLMPQISFNYKYIAGVISIILLPLIVRMGVIGGGLSIPPIWKKS